MNKLYTSDMLEYEKKERTMPNIKMLVFFTGFCFGMVLFYAKRNYVINRMGLLNYDVMLRLKGYYINKKEFIDFLCKYRIEQFIIIFLCFGNMHWIKILYCMLFYIGVKTGMISFCAVYQYGIKGILFLITSIIPQCLFYLIVIYSEYKNKKRSNTTYFHKEGGIKQKSFHNELIKVGIIILYFIIWMCGVFAEGYISPDIINKVINIF